MTLQVANLGDLLKNRIGDGKIVDTDISRLTAPGENYGSVMLKVDVTVTKNGQNEVIHTVAKCVPPNKQMQHIFDTASTFVNEIGWYEQSIPAIKEFQREQGLKDVANYFTELFNARISLDPNSKEVDENGVILFENLVSKGYRNVDRQKGFDLTQAKEIIKKLANFHATCIALKFAKHDIFEHKLKKFLKTSKSEFPVSPEDIFARTLKVLQEDPETASTVPKIIKILESIKNSGWNSTPREPWATTAHSDFWVNNIMIKDDEQPPKVIILDLQVCTMGSALGDLIFFLGVSVQTDLAEKKFDELLKFYYDEFIRVLRDLKATNLKEFSEKSFEEELKVEARLKLLHILIFIPIVLAVKGAVDDVTKEDFDPSVGMKGLFTSGTKEQEEKIKFIVKQYIKHGWI